MFLFLKRDSLAHVNGENSNTNCEINASDRDLQIDFVKIE